MRIRLSTSAGVLSVAIAGLLLAPAAACAQAPQTVAGPARPDQAARWDVQGACPDLARTLERELSPAMLMHGKEGTLRVEVRIQGLAVRDVVSSGEPREYRLPIRSALRGLLCLPGHDGDRFAFWIRFENHPQ